MMPIDSGTPPKAAANSAAWVGESIQLLDRYQKRGSERINFLKTLSEHIRDIIDPAMRKFVADFGTHSSLFEISDANHPLTPSIRLTLKGDANLSGLPELYMIVGYSPSKDADRVDLVTDKGRGEVTINSEDISSITAEQVYSDLSATVSVLLKRQLKNLSPVIEDAD